MIFNKMLLGCLLAMTALAGGCFGGASDGGSPSATGDVAQCEEAFAFAPAGYVINIVGGDAVILDPMANDFQLFCDVNSAKTGLQKALDTKRIPQGDWKIFRVYGTWAELAVESAPGVFLLKRPAPLVDWVN